MTGPQHGRRTLVMGAVFLAALAAFLFVMLGSSKGPGPLEATPVIGAPPASALPQPNPASASPEPAADFSDPVSVATAFSRQYYALSWQEGSPQSFLARVTPYLTPAFAAELRRTTGDGGGAGWGSFVSTQSTTVARVRNAVIAEDTKATSTSASTAVIVDAVTRTGAGAQQTTRFTPTIDLQKIRSRWLVAGLRN